MNDEIKEILDMLKHHISIISVEDEDLLLNYISNLEEKNNKLKDNWNMLKEHLTNRYNNGTESISYRQVFMEIREAMQVLEIAQQLEQEHKKINGELREENNKLEIALQNIQEDYDRRIEEIDVLKKKLDRRYYKNEYERLKQENERLKELNKNASKVCMAEHRYGVDKAEEARDYKSRCEKASEYIGCHFKDMVADEEAQVVLNILQNGSEKDDR